MTYNTPAVAFKTLVGNFDIIDGNVKNASPQAVVSYEDKSDYDIANHVAEDSEDKIFTRAFRRIKRSVAFNPVWKNGTGYLNSMIKRHRGDNSSAIIIILSETPPDTDHLYMVPGEQIKGVDDFGRRFIFTATRLGGVVVFDRYKLDADSTKVFVLNRADELSLIPGMPYSACSVDDLESILGSDARPNLGSRLESIFKESLIQTQTMLNLQA
jgi:hypothetical protein